MRTATWLLIAALGMACSRPRNAQEAVRTSEAPALDRVTLPPGSPKLEQIQVEEVEEKEFAVAEVIAPGKVEVNPNRVSRVLTPLPGRVREVLVHLGDAVREGQPVVVIESREVGDAMAAYLQARAQLRQAQSVLVKAEKDLARLRDLYEHRAVAWKEVVAAETELAQAQAGVEQAQAAAEEAQHRLELLGVDPARHTHEVVVRAPISGKVLEIAVAPGEYRTDTAAALMTIADLSTVWISSQVPESSIRLIEVGEPVEIELAAFPGQVFRGKVRRIADTVDPQSRTVKVQAEIKNPDGRLRPEMFGAIRHTHGSRRLPAVPVTAVMRGDSETWLYLERSPGEFERVRVECGESKGGWTPILAGVKPGDRVVSRGASLLAAM
ncbi:MAG: efflux RND transporter periplasmic adaptor subunit [Bryobacteraceae bacterium]